MLFDQVQKNGDSAVNLGGSLPVLVVGPICIANDYKRQGYGRALLDFAFEKAKKFCGAVLFEDSIDFHGNSGCVTAKNFSIRYCDMPENEDTSFFLCKILKDSYLDGLSGSYSTPEVYIVTKEAVEDFDKAFTTKKKLKLSSQLFE